MSFATHWKSHQYRNSCWSHRSHDPEGPRETHFTPETTDSEEIRYSESPFCLPHAGIHTRNEEQMMTLWQTVCPPTGERAQGEMPDRQWSSDLLRRCPRPRPVYPLESRGKWGLMIDVTCQLG
uniref:Uncharacterized protein n=1 Tax=Pipistrellus kuhlii TaxID=59472 RepID=A0A7J8A7B5_PIPKU|nr:hypothetical protein mPipKuh1_008799 [Pipistrellus kuhlii]